MARAGGREVLPEVASESNASRRALGVEGLFLGVPDTRFLTISERSVLDIAAFESPVLA